MHTRKPRILAIDDTPANLMTLGSALEGEFELQFATSGLAGLALALSAPPELILLDIIMPAVDGFETCKMLKAEPKLQDIPVIFVTADTDLDSETLGLSLGAADYITKPFNVGIARQRIRNLIERERLRNGVEKQRDALELALHEKAGLLYEIHHRVKGNLQVISSLLRLEGDRAQQTETVSVLHNMQGRIRCMALLLETLHLSGGSVSVNLGTYLEHLARQVFRTANLLGGAVNLHTDMASITVGVDQSAACGLFVNELITNALRHGFPDGRKGAVCVGLRTAFGGTEVHLWVSDDGVGMATDIARASPPKLGLQLVSDLAMQLGGTTRMESAMGTKVSLSFAIAQPRQATPTDEVPAAVVALDSPIQRVPLGTST